MYIRDSPYNTLFWRGLPSALTSFWTGQFAKEHRTHTVNSILKSTHFLVTLPCASWYDTRQVTVCLLPRSLVFGEHCLYTRTRVLRLPHMYVRRRAAAGGGARSVRITRPRVADGTRYRGTPVRRMRVIYLPAGAWKVFPRSAAPTDTHLFTMHRMGHRVTGECSNTRKRPPRARAGGQ